jgi:hypothetical protein
MSESSRNLGLVSLCKLVDEGRLGRKVGTAPSKLALQSGRERRRQSRDVLLSVVGNLQGGRKLGGRLSGQDGYRLSAGR